MLNWIHNLEDINGRPRKCVNTSVYISAFADDISIALNICPLIESIAIGLTGLGTYSSLCVYIQIFSQDRLMSMAQDF